MRVTLWHLLALYIHEGPGPNPKESKLAARVTAGALTALATQEERELRTALEVQAIVEATALIGLMAWPFMDSAFPRVFYPIVATFIIILAWRRCRWPRHDTLAPPRRVRDRVLTGPLAVLGVTTLILSIFGSAPGSNVLAALTAGATNITWCFAVIKERRARHDLALHQRMASELGDRTEPLY